MKCKPLNSPLVEEWLSEKRAEQTRIAYKRGIQSFLDYHNLTPEHYLEMSPKMQRALALRFQNEQPNKNPNTLYLTLTAVGNFLEFHDKPIRWKRAKIRAKPDVTSHIFSNGDLTRMFMIGDVKEKAMLSLATSLGWEIRGILKLKRTLLKDLIERAKENEEKFVYFQNIRGKTGAQRLGVLNPLALEWCAKWLKESENYEPMKRDPNRENRINIISDVFDMAKDGFNNMLRRLARKAQIKTTGRVRFHNLRKWVMSGLSRSGFNEYQIKYVLGKSIPMSDMVYLQTLEQEVKERYPEAYENYLNLNPSVSPKAMTTLTKEIDKLKEKNEDLKQQLNGQRPEMRQLREELDDLRKMLKKIVKQED